MLFFVLLISQVVIGNVLPPFDSTILSNPQIPILLVACKVFDEKCNQLQRIVNKTQVSLAEEFPNLISSVTEYSVVETLKPQNEPSLFILRPNEKPVEYTEAWQTSMVRNWVFQMMLPITTDVKTMEELDKILNSETPIVVVLFTYEKNIDIIMKYKAIAEIQASDEVLFVNAVGDEFVSKFNNKEYTVKIRHRIGNQTHFFEADNSTDLITFISNGIFPLYSVFDPMYIHDINDRYILWVFFNQTLNEQYDQLFSEIAIKYHNKMVVTKFDIHSFPEQLEKYGLKTAPSIAILHKNQRTSYPFNGTLTKESVNKFIHDVFNGEAKPYLQSRKREDVGEDEIVSNDLQEYIHKDKCVVIVGCTTQYFRKVWVDPLRKRLPDAKTYFMNLDEDELPPEYDFDDLPIVLIFPENKTLISIKDGIQLSQDAIAEKVLEVCGGTDNGHIEVIEEGLKEQEYQGQYDDYMKSLGLSNADLEDIDDIEDGSNDSTFEDLLKQMNEDNYDEENEFDGSEDFDSNGIEQNEDIHKNKEEL
ncbi:hypothetical protein ENUP19_0298G0059 [Entamoeba nuttalli]|uniref:Thioredoxin n=1 Tax=Entamoeba nuttalli TaxID=412467 RepID=A0ABQ0DUR6_9EUKA